MAGLSNFFSSPLSASLKQLKQSVSLLANSSGENCHQTRYSPMNGLCSETQDDAESMYSSSSNRSMRRTHDSPYDDDVSSQGSHSTVDTLSVDSVFSDKGYKWRWIKPRVEADDSILLEQEKSKRVTMIQELKGENTISEYAAVKCVPLRKKKTNDVTAEQLNTNTELEKLTGLTHGSEAVKSRHYEEDNIGLREDSSVDSSMAAFPVKWPNISFCPTVEGQSDYSDSTIEQRFLASPGQTTFSNPVFDLHPLEGNQMSSDVNMLEKIDGKMHEGYYIYL